ncbi:HGGxSTG domain-containing protein [Paraburkholderia sp. 35.1]|uniref:HGGxSTG domain-containing protein n=1 Tax=Paraburkholderia sp. 35.1 TaxID=2991058 RepID=UPI003D1A3D99
MTTDAEKRRRLKAHYAECDRVRALRDELERAAHARWLDHLVISGPRRAGRPPMPALPVCPPFPDDLLGLRCGAKTRAGTPCKRVDLYGSGRCKLHGGLSTGPTTPEGKARAARNGHAPKRKRSP